MSLSRRDFLKTASAATLATVAPRLLGSAAPVPAGGAVSADTVIFLFMAGGMPATETFDPKPFTPFSPGLDPRSLRSTFPSIATSCDSIRLSAGLERLAAVMHLGTLVRSFQPATLPKPLHSLHQYHLHTGHLPGEPLQSCPAPHIGSMIASSVGPLARDIPPFVLINQRFDVPEADELKAHHSAAQLDASAAPLLIPEPARALESVSSLPQGLSPSACRAFDLALESRSSLERYATGRFGLGCLLAKRLALAGARFVEVSTEYVPFHGWDAHSHGHEAAAAMKRQIDSPIAQLVLDLHAAGVLKRTLIVVASEFSRSTLPPNADSAGPIVSAKDYGLHHHSAGSAPLLLFGGGLPGGRLIGQTADEPPFAPVGSPYMVEQLHATLLASLAPTPRHTFS